MKKLPHTLFIVCCFLFFVTGKAQYVTIPDANFVIWLNANGYSACMNGNQMDTTCTAITGAIFMDCSNSNISNLTGIQYFNSLQTLSFSTNLLTGFPPLPQSLTYLQCGGNPLHMLPPLPNSLRYLYIDTDQLDSIISLPDSLLSISCMYNNLKSLPALPTGLLALSCSWNQLTGLPVLPVGLHFLSCNFNQITGLPALPVGLQQLLCHDNQITGLPLLPQSLHTLDCPNNMLTSLPPLPHFLDLLSFDQNAITCLPLLDTVITLYDFSITNITCAPNYGAYIGGGSPGYSYLQSLPLCDSLTPNPCAIANGITATATPVFSLSPNPATNTVTIITGDEMINSTVTVTDITGRVITAVPLPTANCLLPTAAFPNGIYFVTITGAGGGSATKKLIIQK